MLGVLEIGDFGYKGTTITYVTGDIVLDDTLLLGYATSLAS